MSQLAYFSELPINAFFTSNGNLFRKQSSKTAHLVEFGPRKGKRVYFGKNDLCFREFPHPNALPYTDEDWTQMAEAEFQG